MTQKAQTLTITNFGGRLTRIINGDLNSGFAKFNTSWGYDPFSKPMNLTWLEQPSSVAGVTSLLAAMTTHSEAYTEYVYGVSNTGSAFRIQPATNTNANVDSVIGIGSIITGSEFDRTASLEFFGVPEQMYVGGSNNVWVAPLSSIASFGGVTSVASTNNFTQNASRPLKNFGGYLAFGNGPTIGVVSATNTVTSSVIGFASLPNSETDNNYSELNPPFPAKYNIVDLDVSPDFTYLLMSMNNRAPLALTDTTLQTEQVFRGESVIAKWNGNDPATTAATFLPSIAVTALETFGGSTIVFSNDTFGMAISDGTKKLLTLPNNQPPRANATGVNGNFVFWMSVETVDGTSMVGSLYYYGNLDQETPLGLYRLMRFSATLANGFVYQVPAITMVTSRISALNSGQSSISYLGYGKHYFSVMEVNNTATDKLSLQSFNVTPTGSGTSQAGVYETQTQLFSKRIGISQIRVYCEPTVTNNGFQIDIIDVDGSVVTNGSFTYTFAAGSDDTKLQGALQRINFNPGIKTLFGFGIRITNTGTANMTIKKVEVDYTEEGK